MSIITEKLVYMCKEARFDTADLMANLVEQGAIPREEMYGEAEELLEARRKKSLGLRHPWLTGIPTLGIWPAASRERAQRTIASRLIAKHPEMGQQIQDYMDRMYNLQIKSDRANSARNAIGAAALPIATYMAMRDK